MQGQNFCDVLSSYQPNHQQNAAIPSVNHITSRENILNTISQTRSGTAAVFYAPPIIRSNEPATVRGYYSMPPEEVKPMLNKLTEELENIDFSGKTAAEIYEYIENKYKETFGEDFMKGSYLLRNLWATTEGSVNPNVNKDAEKYSNFAYTEIGNHFDWATTNYTYGKGVICSNTSLWDINRERLYGDMSNGEIMDALKAKYPKPMTNRSLTLMAGELWSIGLMDLGVGSYVKAHSQKLGEIGIHGTMPPWEELEERWNKVLDKPADLSLLGAIHNVLLRDKDSSKNPYVIQTQDLLMKLGVETGRGGFFLHDLTLELLELIFGYAPEDEEKNNAFSFATKDLIDDFLETLDRHDKTLRESRERVEDHHNMKENSKKVNSKDQSWDKGTTQTTAIQN